MLPFLETELEYRIKHKGRLAARVEETTEPEPEQKEAQYESILNFFRVCCDDAVM